MTVPHAPEPTGWILPASRLHAAIRIGIGALLVVAGVLCMMFAGGAFGDRGFPSNAPVELLINFGLTVDLVGAGIALLVLGGVALRPRQRRGTRRAVSVFAIVGASLVGVALLAFSTAVPNWLDVLTGVRGRYDGLAGSLFLAGLPWATGMVFATASLRYPSSLSRVIGGVALAVGLALAVAAIAAAALYGADITD